MRSYEFDEGYNAFIKSEGICINPYPLDSEEFDLWEEGYLAAEISWLEASSEIEMY